MAEAVWRGVELAHRTTAARPTGWAELDAELPCGGWPEQSVVEILGAQPAVLEWRLLSPALKMVVQNGGQVVVVGPPRQRRRAHACPLAQATARRDDGNAGGTPPDGVRPGFGTQHRAAHAQPGAAGAALSASADGGDLDAERCAFSLGELRFQYPDEVVPEGHTPTSYLRQLTYEGAGRRCPKASRPRCKRRSSTSSLSSRTWAMSTTF